MQQLNTTEIVSRLEKERKVAISFHYYTENLFKSIDGLFSKILAKNEKIYLLDPIVTVLREIIANAVKANAKRHYFKKLNIDINDQREYAKAIKNFKVEAAGSSKIGKELENTDLMVTLSLLLEDKDLKVIVENNVPLHSEELNRINLRIKKAREYKNFIDAYDEIYDETEMAGLGIVLAILLLKNSGVGEDRFSIQTDGKVTRAEFTIPSELKPETMTTKIKEQILKEIDGLPSFNQNILELLHLCKDVDARMDEIVGKIIVNPALTSDILKLSNSAGFFIGKKVEHINEAILIIGLKNLQDLLLVSGTRSILEKRYSRFGEIWNHCAKTAAYAKFIAQKFSNAKIAELAYLGGLLHDLGKLVLLATDAKLIKWISEITNDRKIRTSTLLEEAALGISHSTIGDLIAKKWNFPDYLINTIKYHHSPLGAGEKFKEFVFPVYLANMFCGIETGNYHYFFLEEAVLERFGLFTQQDAENLLKEMKENTNKGRDI